MTDERAVELDGITVLVIDDSADNRFFIGRWLSNHGARIIEAATGAEGLAMAEQQPDLIVCDVRLPDMNGLDITASIKSNPLLRQTPVIQRSSVAIATDERVEGLTSGADAYLIEPIDERLLVATASALLRFRSASNELEVALSVDRAGVFDWSIVSGRVRWSESLELIHGLPEGGFGGTYDDFVASVHPDDRASVGATLAASLEHDDTIELSFRFLRADGETGWMESRGSIYRDGSNRPIKMLGLARDVTATMIERQRLERLAALARDLNHAPSTDDVVAAVERHADDWGVSIEWSEPQDEADSGEMQPVRLTLADDDTMLDSQAQTLTELVRGSLARAALFEVERDNAVALQHALLPASTPRIDGWRIDTVYDAARFGDRLGGDFFDIVELDDGLFASVGDVAGHGLEATRQMGALRFMLRTIASEHGGDPEAVLRHACALARSVCGGDTPFATAIVARARSSGRVEFASAGHPPPIVSLGGVVSVLDVSPTPPVGVVAHVTPAVTTVDLAPGDWVVCYTDGVFEGRGGSVVEAVRSLAPQLRSPVSANDVLELGLQVDALNQDDRAVVVLERH